MAPRCEHGFLTIPCSKLPSQRFGHRLDLSVTMALSAEVAQPMRQLQPVIWSKGTFLSPQHLQAQERFVEDSARFYLDSLNARSWGFREIQHHTKALSEGRLAVTRAS